MTTRRFSEEFERLQQDRRKLKQACQMLNVKGQLPKCPRRRRSATVCQAPVTATRKFT
jgi:hypothetical protein